MESLEGYRRHWKRPTPSTDSIHPEFLAPGIVSRERFLRQSENKIRRRYSERHLVHPGFITTANYTGTHLVGFHGQEEEPRKAVGSLLFQGFSIESPLDSAWFRGHPINCLGFACTLRISRSLGVLVVFRVFAVPLTTRKVVTATQNVLITSNVARERIPRSIWLREKTM